MTPSAAITVGGVASTIGMALLAQSTTRHALPIFVATATAGGIGFSLMSLGGLSLINANAPADHRGGVLSALYFTAFVMQALIVSPLGVAATAWGPDVAVDLGAIVIALLSVSAISPAISIGRRSPRELVLRKGSVSVTIGD